MLTVLMFYLFAAAAIIGSVCVIFSKNPVYSVLWLIFTFFNASGLFMLLGAEFLSMMLIIVYVGAVAVLFLFVIMMLDISQVKNSLSSPFAIIIMLLLVGNFAVAFVTSAGSINQISRTNYPILSNDLQRAPVTNSHAIGEVLYTDFILHFQAAGLLLFVAMIGSIALTLRHKNWVLRQNNQTERKDEVELVSVKIREGVDGIDY